MRACLGLAQKHITKKRKKGSHLITETKRHRERLFCLKNVVATCKYVFRNNFITNCPVGQRLGNYGTLCSFLRDPAAVGAVGGEFVPGEWCGEGLHRPGVLLSESRCRLTWGSGSPSAPPPSRLPREGSPTPGSSLSCQGPLARTWHLGSAWGRSAAPAAQPAGRPSTPTFRDSGFPRSGSGRSPAGGRPWLRCSSL